MIGFGLSWIGKNAIINRMQLRNLWAFSYHKRDALISYLMREQIKNKLIIDQNHSKFVELVKQDTMQQGQRYKNYRAVRAIFEKYLEQLSNANKEYNPENNLSNARKLSQLLDYLSSYPQFKIQKQQLQKVYQVFCKFLHARSDQQLNKALKFVLKSDPRAEESVVFGEFLKFYLGERWEVLKAKYHLKIKDQSLGQFISKMASNLIQRGFMRRTPDYVRNLEILYPAEILKLIIDNKSTKQSLMIRKIIFKELFEPICRHYEQIMKQNLYHKDNVKIWTQLNQIAQLIFDSSRNPLLQRQCSYLRQFYIKLFLVLSQQQKVAQLQENILKIGLAYDYLQHVNKYEDSQIVRQFKIGVLSLIQKNRTSKKMDQIIQNQKKQANKQLFALMKNFPHLQPLIMKKIGLNLVPATFNAYFQQITSYFGIWEKSIYEKILNSSQNYFDNIELQKCLSLLQNLKPQNLNDIQIYNEILESIINKDYKSLPQIVEVIQMMEIYKYHKKIQSQKMLDGFIVTDRQKLLSKLEQNLKTLRLFLFRYLADHKQSIKTQQLQTILEMLIFLDDSASFSDQFGNYDANIYQQFAELVQESNNLLLNNQIVQKILEKFKKKDSSQDLKNQIRKLVSKIRQ